MPGAHEHAEAPRRHTLGVLPPPRRRHRAVRRRAAARGAHARRCASLRAPRIKGAELRLVNLCENALIDDEGAGRIGGACPSSAALPRWVPAVTSPLPNGGAHVASSTSPTPTASRTVASRRRAPARPRSSVSTSRGARSSASLSGSAARGCAHSARRGATPSPTTQSPLLRALARPHQSHAAAVRCAALAADRDARSPSSTSAAARRSPTRRSSTRATRRRSSLASPSRTAMPSSPPTSRRCAEEDRPLALAPHRAGGRRRPPRGALGGGVRRAERRGARGGVRRRAPFGQARDRRLRAFRCPGLRSPSVQVLCCRDVSDDLLAAVTLETFPALKKLKS